MAKGDTAYHSYCITIGIIIPSNVAECCFFLCKHHNDGKYKSLTV